MEEIVAFMDEKCVVLLFYGRDFMEENVCVMDENVCVMDENVCVMDENVMFMDENVSFMDTKC